MPNYECSPCFDSLSFFFSFLRRWFIPVSVSNQTACYSWHNKCQCPLIDTRDLTDFFFCHGSITASLASFFNDVPVWKILKRVINNFLVIQKYDLRLFRNEKVRGCGSSVPHRQAIYKAYQSSFLFHTVGSFSDLHCGACWLCCMHGHEGRSNERGLNWRGRKLYELSFVSLNPYAELAFRCIMPGICNDLQNTF